MVEYPGMPLPMQVNGQSVQAVARGPGRMQWQSAQDPRVAARFDALLGDVSCGVVHIDVAQVCGGVPDLQADESYVLDVSPAGIHLRAPQTWGALHGLSTLAQLAAAGRLDDTWWHIEDRPRFVWRGVMLDPARHFLPPACVLEVLQGMAALKLNVLHLHLSDDQGFRFPSQAFPDLASERHYARADLEALVQQAADLGIRVVPELDMPGHVTSWLVAYPQWGCEPVTPTNRFGVHEACLDVTAEQVHAAVEALLQEVTDIFPDQYIHIGGDEVHPRWWREHEGVQRFMAEQALADETALQAHFNRHVCTVLQRIGRQPMGWDETLHDDMPAMLIQNWRGATTRDRALHKGLDCIFSAGYYLDLFYPADMHYRFDPEMPQADMLALEDEMRLDPRLVHVAQGIAWTDQWRAQAVDAVSLSGSVLGGEACLWSELVDEHTVFVRLFSRLPAVAERLWSPATVNDVHSMYRRLQSVLGLAPFGLAARVDEALGRAGFDAPQREVLALLEPVKWYARLLGEQALHARISGSEMPQARPYRVDTPLDRAVDFIAPESFAARDLHQLPDRALAQLAARWRGMIIDEWPSDLRPAIAAMAELGTVLDRWFKGSVSNAHCQHLLQQLYVPQGEYMLAVIPQLLRRIERGV